MALALAKGKVLLLTASSTKIGSQHVALVQKRGTSASLGLPDIRPIDVVDLQEQPHGDNIIATVFGANGNIGRMVVKYLARANAQVVAPYRGEERYSAFLKVAGDVGQIVPLRWTIYDKQAIQIAVSQSKFVVNVCGRTWETKNYNFQQANVESAVAIAQACKDAGVSRLIHVSSVAVGKNTQSKFVKAKADSEEEVKKIFPDVTIVRITTPFGERDHFLHKFGYMISKFPFFLLLVNRDTKIQPVYTADVAKAINQLLRDPRTKGKTYELGGPDTITFQNFADMILKNTKFDGLKPILAFSPTSWVAKILTQLFNRSRNKIYTSDELLYYQTDNVADAGALGFKDLGIKPRSIHDASSVFQLFKNKLRL
eukprot:TRINITY_DN2011_c0_g1_i1.p1 TRINITY_DN2011_c0_g1~~TRINITY_DN2011_c0_g1_i1.p1  ORF type:complete len:406 (-),score=76.72 TRINITY_DN2011_c0_g1_i1:80-1189(-)